MEWVAWAVTNIRFVFFYIVNIIVGDKSNEYFAGKEETLEFFDIEEVQPKDYVEGDEHNDAY